MTPEPHSDDLQWLAQSAELKATGHGHLLRNMVLFGRLLRGVNLKVTPTQILDWVAALEHIDLRHRSTFKDTARTILVNRYEHLPLFDRAFDLFWQARAENVLADVDLGQLLQQKMPQADEIQRPIKTADEEDEGQGGEESEPSEIENVLTYSAREVLRRKDFADLTPTEMGEIKRLIQEMEWDLHKRRTRRQVSARRGARLDMRRTFRQNLRYGYEPLRLSWRRPKLKRRPLVVIADISGSMERYARVLLKFIYAISSGLGRVEAFAFATRLTRITRQLKEKDIDAALDQAMGQILDWGGGTRIGESLKTFNYEWGRRTLGQGAIVLIISDGWDRGEIDLLEREMRRLQLSCQRLIWLNPLLGSEHYEPLTRGIQVALPYIDDFMPVHNLVSLEQLGMLLQSLGEVHPLRRQQPRIKKAP